MTSIAGLAAWEAESWIADGDDLPAWLAALRKRHLAAVDEYAKSVSYVVDSAAQIEADNRAHRRAVRDAIAAGKEPPTRAQTPEVDEAVVDVAAEDSEWARMELAAECVEILDEIRGHLHEFPIDVFLRSSPEFRFALARGPQGGDGMTEDERQRKARQENEEQPDDIIDIDDPANAAFTKADPEVMQNAA